MKHPGFDISEKKSYTPFLIIDKKGIFGKALIEKLQFEFLVTFVSASVQNRDFEKTTTIPYRYRGKILPKIPQSHYAYVCVVYNGEKEIRKFIPELFESLKWSGGKIIFIVSKNLIEKSEIQDIKNRRGIVLVYGDLFGPALPFNYDSPCNEIFYQAVEKKRILVKNFGLSSLYPVYFDDVIDSVMEVAFGTRGPDIYCVFQKHPITELGFSRMFQKNDPSILVDFIKVKEAEKKTTTRNEKELYLLGLDYPLLNRIKNTSKKTVSIAPEETRSHFLVFKKFTLFLMVFLTFLLLLPFLSSTVFFTLGVWQLKSAKGFIQTQEYSRAEFSTFLSSTFFKIAKSSGNLLIYESRFMGKSDVASPFVATIDTASHVSEAFFLVLSSQKTYMEIFTGKSKYPNEDFFKATNDIHYAITSIQQVLVEGNLPQNISSEIQTAYKSFEVLSSIVQVLPEIFGQNSGRSYLILFQNNAELRPTGGFIGSYGILRMKNGKTMDFAIHDVYDADGKLKGHVEPPYGLRRYMGTKHWFLRDSNFDVDFEKSASSAAFFLRQEIGEEVSGVIGLDLYFLKKILGVIGPVVVSDYQQTVDENNFYSLIQFQTEDKFFPGSTQKKDVLRSLYRAILLKLQEDKKISRIKLLDAFSRSVKEKHVLFAFSDASIQQVLTAEMLSSSLNDTRQETKNSIIDFIGVIDANVGANKVNYFIHKKQSFNLTVSHDGEVLKKLTISYRNTSTATDKWGGDYKNYVQIIIPKNSRITSFMIDGKNQATKSAIVDQQIYERENYTSLKEIEIAQEERGGVVILGFFLVIPQNALKTITISYIDQKKIDTNLPLFSYNMWWFKQPGVDADSISFSLTHPDNYMPLAAKEFDKRENTIFYSGNLKSDKRFQIDFSKK